MKKLLFISLLIPLSLMAQKDSGIHFHTGLCETAKPDSPHLVLENLSYTGGPDWRFSKPLPLTIKVFDMNTPNSTKLLMETDTSGNIRVYGDTLSVLKAIIKSYGIKIK